MNMKASIFVASILFSAAVVEAKDSDIAAAFEAESVDATCLLKPGTICRSDLPNSTVLIATRPTNAKGKKSKNDLTAKFGAAYYLVVVNKSADPITISPSTLTIVSKGGKQFKILTADELKQRADAAAKRKRTTGSIFGALTALAGGAAAGYGSSIDPTAGSNLMMASVATADAIQDSGEASALEAQFAGTEAEGQYSQSEMVETVVPPGGKYSSKAVVADLNDDEPVLIKVPVGREVHSVRFSKKLLVEAAR